jgi:sigma-B regulation protein RsbQ
MSIKHRNNVQLHGNGGATIVFAHGFGCDQTVWRFITPAFADRFKIVTFDLVGSGGSDLSAYDRTKYGSLHGYADDLLEIIDEFAAGPVVFVGHSVSAMIGMLATIKAPGRFAAQVMVSPSPSYIDDGDYVGGFSRADIDELLDTMDANYLGWSGTMGPAIMGAPDQPQLGAELANRFCRNDPGIARHFAKVTFLSDHRSDVPRSATPALILQCSDDMIAPRKVGEYLHKHLPNSSLQIIDNVGHCPHMSAPTASSDAINAFLERTLR